MSSYITAAQVYNSPWARDRRRQLRERALTEAFQAPMRRPAAATNENVYLTETDDKPAVQCKPAAAVSDDDMALHASCGWPKARGSIA